MSTTCSQKRFQLACYTSTCRSLRTQFWRETSLNPVQNEMHFNPHIILVRLVVLSIFKSHLITFKDSSGEGGFVICTSKHFLFDIFYAYCSGGKSFPHQLWTVWFFDDFFYDLFWVFCISIWGGYRWLRFVERLSSKLLVALGKILLIHCLLFFVVSVMDSVICSPASIIPFFLAEDSKIKKEKKKEMVINFWNWLLFRYFCKTTGFLIGYCYCVTSGTCLARLIFQTSADYRLCFGSFEE